MPRACPLTHNLGVVSCTYRMVRRKHIVFNTLSTLSVVNQAMRRVEGNVLDSKSVSIRQAPRADFELRGPYVMLQILIFRFEKWFMQRAKFQCVCMFGCFCVCVLMCLGVWVSVYVRLYVGIHAHTPMRNKPIVHKF